MLQLINRKILITGAASGIGRAIAIYCIYAGADGIILEVHPSSELALIR